jgi:hypothetical protein
MGKFVKGNTVGRQFQKGVGGNPRGRPKAIVEVARVAREFTLEGIEILKSIARNTKATDTARAMAVNTLLDRAWGKAPVSIDLHRHDDVRNLSDAELLLIIGNAADDSGAGVIESAPDPGKLN